MNSLLHSIAKKNDARAFRQFYVMYYDRLYKFALHIIRSEQYSEEVVSDVFMAIWQNRKRLTGIENIEAYLYRSVKNTALNYIRKYKYTPQQSVPIATVHYIASDSHTPEDDLLHSEVERRLQQAIDSLPEQCRIIFKLAHEDNLKYKQIAEILDISVKTIDAQMAIARQKLKAALNKE